MRRKHSFLEKLLLTAALAVGAGGCGTLTPNGIPSSITGSAVRSRVFPNAIAFWIPEGLDVETVRDQVNSGIRDVLKDYVVGDTLEPILNFFGADLDNSGDPRFRFFVKTDDMTEWVQNLTVCPGKKVRVSLIYEPGSNQNSSPPHLGGLNYGIYSTPLGQAALPSTEIADYNLLPSGEESANPPNFLIETNLRNTSWMMMHEGSSLPDPLPSYVDRIYTIGRPYNAEDNAVVVVDVGCDGNINTEPEHSSEPETSPSESAYEPNPENCGPSHLEDCISRGACERAEGFWYDRGCHETSGQSSEPEDINPEDCASDRLESCISLGACERVGGVWYDRSCHASGHSQESCSGIEEGTYTGTNLYAVVGGTASYDALASIAFNSLGNPMLRNSSGNLVEAHEGLRVTNNDLELTITDVTCSEDCVSLGSEITGFSGITGTCEDTYCSVNSGSVYFSSSCRLTEEGSGTEERLVSGELSR